MGKLGREAQAVKAGFGSFGQGNLESGVLAPQSVAQKGLPGLQLGTSLSFSDLLLHGEGAQPEGSQERGLLNTRPRLGGFEEGRALPAWV